ncbi:MAG TPA: S-layer homology domain-containing protein [Acidimicrobiia bacterium]|nr:S-layer homology domain-containing protein [Acidimicrobiia bacterium]
MRKSIVVAVMAGLVGAVIAAPIAVYASHSFGDVPSSDTFHSDIAWLASNEVTRGCNPPANSRFCPDDDVTRGQMAAFMKRFAGTFGVAEDGAGDVPIAVPEDEAVEVLSLQVDPKHEAEVVLNATLVIFKLAGGTGSYEASLHRGDCSGTLVGHETRWVTEQPAAADSLSLTAVDTVSSTTTYKVCAQRLGTSPAVSVRQRALTAFWLPVG